MDKFNLLDADDFFSQMGSDKDEKKDEPEKEEIPDTKKPETADEPEKPEIPEEPEDLIINVDDEPEESGLEVIDETAAETETSEIEEPEDVSVEILKDEPEIDETPEIIEEVPTAETEISDEPEEEEITDESEIKTKTAFVDDYYEEAQQEKVNIKPILIIVGILVVLAIIGFTLWSVFSGEEEAPPPVVEKVKQPSPEELRRLNFLADNANKNAVNLGTITEIMNLNSKKTKITSVYLYGEEFIFEVFCPSRDVLGKFNMDIKSKYPNGHFNLQTSQVRPGTKGGIFGVYTVSIAKGAASRDSTINFKSENAFESWFSGKAAQENLKLVALKNTNSFSNNGFKVVQYEGTVNGDYQSCFNLINSLKSERRNIDFYKLTINSRNLKSFSSKKYQLSFIIRLYL
jgi:hypothetical protein